MSSIGPIGPMNPVERERAGEVIGFLQHCLAESLPFVDRCFRNPEPESFVARASRQRHLAMTLDSAPLLASAADHYRTLVTFFLPPHPVPNFSPYAVVRAAYEADARACWLTDLGITEQERVGRAMTERAENLFEIRRMGLPAPDQSDANYRDRIKRTEAAAKAWRLKSKVAKDGRVSFVDRPRITSLFKTLLPDKSPQNPKMTVGEHTYAALSARAHGTLWALIANATTVARLGEYRKVGLVELDVLELLRLTGIAFSLHDRAIADVAVLAGFDVSEWEVMRGRLPW